MIGDTPIFDFHDHVGDTPIGDTPIFDTPIGDTPIFER